MGGLSAASDPAGVSTSDLVVVGWRISHLVNSWGLRVKLSSACVHPDDSAMHVIMCCCVIYHHHIALP